LDLIMNTPRGQRDQMIMAGALVVILIGLSAALLSRPKSKVVTPLKATIFDTRLKILWAQMLQGSNTYYLPAGGDVLGSGGLGSSLEAQIRQGISRLGVDPLPAVTPGKGPDGRAFLICYAFPDPPTSSMHLDAELVGHDGTLFLLRSATRGGGGPPERSWDLWILDSLPSGVTNYTLRLKLQTNGTAVAEIRFAEP
jgi:hypothetical protein